MGLLGGTLSGLFTVQRQIATEVDMKPSVLIVDDEPTVRHT